MKTCYFILIFSWSIFGYRQSLAQQKQTDSLWVSVLPEYNKVSKTHRKIFGENYRKEYALKTKLPVIHLSKISGGLKAIERGGGFQTRSLRLIDAEGREWTLRGIEKYPQVLLPKSLRETFVSDILKDNMSAQHPFAALIVPVLADAIGAPHTSPIIGWVAQDPGLEALGSEFAGTICLLEEREPIGKSDNTPKMLRKLKQDHNNTLNATLYLKLKCLDVLIGDWDRHEDQWRWRALKSPSGISYMPVPRDRDQVFYRSDGLVQRFAQQSWLLPMMQGYEREIKDINWFLWEGREINSKWFAALDQSSWDQTVEEFTRAMTDERFEEALRRLPEPGYTLRHDQLLAQLQQRRKALPQMMREYYRFFNRIVDIELSDGDEIVDIRETTSKGLSVQVKAKESSDQPGKHIYQRDFDPAVTHELRLYLHSGSDSVTVNSPDSRIRVRIIGEHGNKSYLSAQGGRSIRVYSREDSVFTYGNHSKFVMHRANDSLNTAYVAKEPYSRHLLLPILGFNNDDGLALGASFRYIRPGFRKQPYGSSQTFSLSYSAATSAISFAYKGEWTKVLANADLVIQAIALAPNNTRNFFGSGNQTSFDRSLGIGYYRARFNLYELSPALRWGKGHSSLTAGPTLQYYSYHADENTGRFIATVPLHSADSTVFEKDKGFAGVQVKYNLDSRDNPLIPSKGILAKIDLSAYQGLNRYASSFGQLQASISFHQKLDSAARIVLADRVGAGMNAGHAPFYQSQFLGGQGNLLGYRQFRFAGDYSFYNNFEARMKLADVASYILPGQIGLIGLYDLGRVWKDNEQSKAWHHGVGGGIYFAPASLSLIRLVAGYSREGWYPYFAFSFRY